MVQIEVVEGAAHAPQALLRVGHHHLGGGKGLPRLQAPAEVRGVDARQHSWAAPGVHLDVKGEVAAVHQAQAHGLPLLLGGGVLAQGHKGVVVGAGHAPLGLDALDAVLQGVADGGVLFGPPAVHVDHVTVHGGQVQAGAVGPLQGDRGAAAVLDPRAAGHDAVVLKHGVEQVRLYPGDGVHGLHFQGLGLGAVVVGGGKAGELGLPLGDLVGNVPQVGDGVPRPAPDGQGGDAHVPGAIGGVLQGGDVRGEEPLPHLGVPGAELVEPAPEHQVGKVRVRHLGPVVQVDQVPLFVHGKGVGGSFGVQPEQLFLRQVGDCHKISSLFG